MVAKRVLQIRVALVGILPPIWRRIQIPAHSTFWDLHVAIQDAMGWLGYHLHDFHIPDHRLGGLVRIGIPDEESDTGLETLPGWDIGVQDYMQGASAAAVYIYDFGDGWIHVIQFEGELPAAKGRSYPICVDGERKCPPEDCGGIGGYALLLKALANSNHPEHESLLEWVGGHFDAEDFNPKDVEFGDPQERLRLALE